MLEPKFRRPGKPGHIWPGVWQVPKSYQNKTHPWHFACPAPLCFYRGSYADQLAANKIQETHPCPWFGGGKTTLSWGIMSDMFLAPIWKKLDDAVDDLMAEKARDQVGGEREYLNVLQGTARGIAEALAVLMPPFFSTGDEIVQEAMVRYEKRQAGEDYETPGIGRLRFKVPPGAEVLTPSGIPHELVIGTKSQPEHHPAMMTYGLSDANIQAILTGHDSGFQVKMLATAYGVSENAIRGILKSHGKA